MSKEGYPISENPGASGARRFFTLVTAYPKTILILGIVLIIGLGSQLPKMVKDTRVDAFIPPDHPALQYRETVKNIFGLKDPMIVAIVNTDTAGIFNPNSLNLVSWISRELESVPNVDPDRITSLATENNIIGEKYDLVVEPFLDPLPETEAEARQIHQAVMNFPLYVGNLVAKDGSATLIVFEMLDEAAADQTYQAVQALLARAPVTQEALHVAGEAAVGGYWSAVIDRDSQRLQPLAGLVIGIVLVIAFRSLRGTLLPFVVVIATAAGTMGAMAAFGVPYFAITNALPVILIGIAVADSIHIFSQYYEEQALDPTIDSRELVLRTMDRMWRPVTLTTLTTLAGFFGIAISSIMPPMTYFGLFAMLGVTLAFVYSLFFLPAALILLSPKGSAAFKVAGRPTVALPGPHGPRPDIFARGMTQLGSWSARFATPVVLLAALLTAAGIYGAMQLKVERARIANINPGDPLHIADSEINKRFNGTSYIDVVVETDEDEGLYSPMYLTRIEALQTYFETLPHVQGTVSIVDYLKQMNRAMSENAEEAYQIPVDDDLVAQYFLLYSATGDPADFEEEVDYGYTTANVRVFMNSGFYSDGKVVVEAAQQYIDEEFDTPGISATLSGRVTVDYHWLERLSQSHFQSVGLALALVWGMASLMFRSVGAGTFATVPVAFAVLLVYAVMGLTGITLEPATSMFAAIAIGLGVDFSIHTVERLIHAMRDEGKPMEEALLQLFPSTGRALFFNFAAIFLGFSTLLSSELPTISRFGGLISVAVLAGFSASLILVPALVVVFKPRFLRPNSEGGGPSLHIPSGAAAILFCLAVSPMAADASELPSGEEIARNIDAREAGTILSQHLRMTLTNRSGAQRVRDTRVFRQNYPNENRVAIFFENPTRLKGTAFLTWDFASATEEDAQWLYLPAARRVRRISAGDRGDYFLGTDFTYEDVKKETKIALEDYTFKTLGTEALGELNVYILEAIPKTPEIARELGYTRLLAQVRPDIWMPIMVEYWDKAGNPLKTVRIGDVRQHEGIWTAFRIEAENHKTGHHTLFEYTDVSYGEEFDSIVFTEQGLRRGI